MKTGTCVLLTALAVVAAGPLLAQETQTADAPPTILRIGREEVKPGKDAAHEANETAWSTAYAKAKLPAYYLGMTSMTGPSEAWWLSGFGSWEEMEKVSKAEEALSAETNKLWAQDGEFLSRASAIIASYRPALSYRAQRSLATKRYMQVQMTRVKPGHVREFMDAWKEIVAAHEKAKMEEAWAIYQVVSGMPDGTFLYLQTRTSLAEVDKAGPMHDADVYLDAIGFEGRTRQLEMNQAAVEWSQSLLFRFSPKMSYVPQAWVDADAFWAPMPASPAKKPAEKK